MVNENNSSLFEIYQNFFDEAEVLENEIKENEFSISETEDYLDQLYNQESDDFKVFSPRNVLNKQKKEIDFNKEKIEKLQNNNIYLKGRLQKINSYLFDLRKVMEEMAQRENNSSQPNYEVIDALTKERKRIAEDLHDTTLQNLTHLTYMIALAQKYMEKDVSRAKYELENIDEKIRLSINELRDTIYNIHPLYFGDMGFQKSVNCFYEKLKEIYPEYNICIEIDPDIEDTTNKLMQITIFRIMQEASNNAVEHSGGNELQVKLKKEGEHYLLKIKDNGNGICDSESQKSGHYGLSIMKERTKLLGGTFHMETTNEGTEISIYVPA